MYNFACDYQFVPEMYQAQCYQWNYPMFYLPVSSYSSGLEINNFSHYQMQKRQNEVSTPPVEDQSSYKLDDEEFQLEKSEYSCNESQKSMNKKKRKYYGTKNTQANIINQTFSFMNCGNKSRKVLQKLLKGDQRKIDIFYIMMKIVKRNLKKYVNRCYLKSIFDMEKNNTIFKLLSKGVKRLEILSIDEFKEIFRRLVYYYFTSDMVAHLLSSNRLSKNTIGEHLKRRREIMSHIFQLAQ